MGYLLYHLYGKKLISQGPKGLVKPALILLFAIVLLAVATGRANAIFALIGGLVAAAWRVAPLLMRFYPQIRQFLHRSGAQQHSTAGASRVTTATLAMTLDHQTGQIDGSITSGSFAGRTLSSLNLTELEHFYEFCIKKDPEAVRLLDAYIQKVHPEAAQHWAGAGQQSTPAEEAGISLDDAWNILGLSPGASKAEITRAHRTLMTKLHPDKGGNDYLATRVNQAKDRLLAELNK